MNPNIATGEIELDVASYQKLGGCQSLPMNVFPEDHTPEETRLKYRFLDLRRSKLHKTVMLRSQIISSIQAQDDRARLPGIPDADFDLVLARGRARLPRAVAALSGRILRPAAGAAAVQAVAHGQRLRPLLPDRPLLPRRGRPCRPHARRVLPARRGDELRHAGRHLRRNGSALRPALPRVQAGMADERARGCVSAADLSRFAVALWNGQAGFADSV